jgi:hypothetical protein
MTIPDLDRGKIVRKQIDVEGWIGAGSGKRPDIDQQADLGLAQHTDELIQAAV